METSTPVSLGRLGRYASFLGIAGGLAFAVWSQTADRSSGGSQETEATPRLAAVGTGPELARGSVVRRQLAVGASHEYRIRLPRGSYLRLIVIQRGTDACVALRSPSGRPLLEVDTPTGTEGQEELSALVAASGEYRVAVRGATASPGGTYELHVEEVRLATGEDRRRAAAVQAFSRAEQLRAAGRARPLRAAIDHYEIALRQWPDVEETAWEAMVRRRLGQTWSVLGEVRRAHRAFQQALSFYRERGNRTEEARLLNEIGPTWRLMGEPDKAAECYQRVLHLARETGDRFTEVTALNNLGVVYYRIDPQKALTFLERALAGWRELADPAREADTLQNLGESYILLGHLEESITLLSQALVLKRQVNDRRGEAGTLATLGWAHYRAGDLAAALRAYDRSLALRQETGDQRGEASTLDRRATVLAKLGRKREALASYRAALAILQRVGDRSNEGYVLVSLGELDEASGRAESALKSFAQALQRFQQTGDHYGDAPASARWGRARVARQLGRLSLAQSEIEEALRIVESLHSEVQNRAFRTSYLAARQDYYDLYVEILMARHEREPGQGWEAKALEVSNRARARSLLQSLAEAQANHLAATEPALLAAAQSLETRIRARELRRLELLEEGPANREVAALERELSTLLLEYESLQGRIRSANPRVVALAHGPLGIREIQQLLDPDTLLLWYALGPERSFLWVVGHDSIAAHPLAGRAEIEATARQVHDLLTNSHKKGLREQARLAAAVLSDMVLGPAAGRLGSKRLLIAADGALQYVPFAALPVGGRRVPLLTEHEIVRIPSAAVLALVRRGLAERRPAARTLAVVADPVFRRDDPRVLRRAGAVVPARRSPPATAAERSAREVGMDGFDRLVFSAAEAEAILALVPEPERLEALGFRASRAMVLSGELSRYRILHFATHGLLNERHPELSGVVLSLVDEEGRPQDGFLRVHDLVHLNVPAELVVLSACRTALGKEIRGEGLVGLAHGFLVAGAGRVLVSLWNVNDLATAELMERFYRHLLQDGMRPAEALRAAQLSMLREERWAAPYYWAGFTLQGEWR